ncbi:major tail sheath domain protein, partial [Escherichia coli 90.0039]
MYTRTAQVLADSIAEAQFETIDSPLTPANVKDVISAIRAKLDSLVTAGKLNRPGFPGECFICELRLPDHRFRWK